jgi:hypothetical protein
MQRSQFRERGRVVDAEFLNEFICTAYAVKVRK